MNVCSFVHFAILRFSVYTGMHKSDQAKVFVRRESRDSLFKMQSSPSTGHYNLRPRSITPPAGSSNPAKRRRTTTSGGSSQMVRSFDLIPGFLFPAPCSAHAQYSIWNILKQFETMASGIRNDIIFLLILNTTSDIEHLIGELRLNVDLTESEEITNRAALTHVLCMVETIRQELSEALHLLEISQSWTFLQQPPSSDFLRTKSYYREYRRNTNGIEDGFINKSLPVNRSSTQNRMEAYTVNILLGKDKKGAKLIVPRNGAREASSPYVCNLLHFKGHYRSPYTSAPSAQQARLERTHAQILYPGSDEVCVYFFNIFTN